MLNEHQVISTDGKAKRNINLTYLIHNRKKAMLFIFRFRTQKRNVFIIIIMLNHQMFISVMIIKI